ncbi:uncharacterized protein L201_004358 [Kwoniella dendrophila CBS 6074]|uniref:F-box domain-containing protein n=1 Tax=Kwoniella dendrophila CBS 6074 TaxID=1295534 RepID=A0AAX4JX11_9TREE
MKEPNHRTNNEIENKTIAGVRSSHDRQPNYMSTTASQRQRQHAPLSNIPQPKHQNSIKRNTQFLVHPTNSAESSKLTKSLSTKNTINPTQTVNQLRVKSTSSDTKKKIPVKSANQLHIPDDIIRLIAILCDSATRVKLMSTSSSAYHVIAPILYKEIEINEKNVESLFLGFPGKSKARYNKSKNFEKRMMQDVYLQIHEIKSSSTRLPQWPDIALLSEDEYDLGIPPQSSFPRTGARPRQLTISPFPPYHPNRITTKRKHALFHHTLNLKINCRIPTRLCENLSDWILKRKKEMKRSDESLSTALFPYVENLIITDVAVKQWADKLDRICPAANDRFLTISSSDTINAFTWLIKNMATPKNVCLTIPTLSGTDRDQYLKDRSAPFFSAGGDGLQNLVQSESLQQRRTEYFENMVENIWPSIITFLNYEINKRSLRNLVIHNYPVNLSIRCVFYETPNRIYFVRRKTSGNRDFGVQLRDLFSQLYENLYTDRFQWPTLQCFYQGYEEEEVELYLKSIQNSLNDAEILMSRCKWINMLDNDQLNCPCCGKIAESYDGDVEARFCT